MYAKKKKTYENGGLLDKLKKQAAAAKQRASASMQSVKKGVSEGVESVKGAIVDAKVQRAEQKKEAAKTSALIQGIKNGEYDMIGEYDSIPDLSRMRRQDRMKYQQSQIKMKDMGDGVSAGEKTFTYKDMEGYQPKDYKITQDSDGKYRVYLKKENNYSEGGSVMKAKKKKMYGYPGGGKLELMYKKGGMLGKRKVLDANKDGKITKEDFAILRAMSKKRKKNK
mgnify:CR=1 FL=1|tara:strand:- start:281 stop:952 length:672 start_codon:yes stop_codon:yes gene_type:complete